MTPPRDTEQEAADLAWLLELRPPYEEQWQKRKAGFEAIDVCAVSRPPATTREMDDARGWRG